MSCNNLSTAASFYLYIINLDFGLSGKYRESLTEKTPKLFKINRIGIYDEVPSGFEPL
jgi:hypothetical protein